MLRRIGASTDKPFSHNWTEEIAAMILGRDQVDECLSVTASWILKR